MAEQTCGPEMVGQLQGHEVRACQVNGRVGNWRAPPPMPPPTPPPSPAPPRQSLWQHHIANHHLLLHSESADQSYHKQICQKDKAEAKFVNCTFIYVCKSYI